MLLPKFEFHEPGTMKEALELKKRLGSSAKLLAGGTDLLVHLKKKIIKADHIISLQKLETLVRITDHKDSIEIGACAVMAKISAAPVVKEKFSALKSGVENIGTHLVRNRATLGGNVCNASPAGDSLPALLIYKAVVLLESLDAKREIPIEDFFKGPGKTDIKTDEILTGFRLPVPSSHSGAHYIQLGKRKSSEINVVNVASFLEFDPESQKILNARIALGSVAATPIRALKAEAALKDKIAAEASFYEAGETARFEDCKPIDDFRGSAGYRRAMVGVLTKRTLSAAFELAKS